MKLLLASNNAKKLKELQRILDQAGLDSVELLALADVDSYDEPVENGRTFTDNALIKARAGVANTGFATIADDSGIAVEELNGMPGVLSARWSGAHGNDQANNDLLLAQMEHVPSERRQAAFVSVCALVLPDGQEFVQEGRWEGDLLRAPKGDNGFGYDPLFVPAEETAAGGQGRSSAELTAEEKDALSHRGKALRGLVEIISTFA
ncbi:Non-canonical purine NTP pyrophosphatase [Corynebacterium deserti GIMN1.010]|uniref:dITP/XTP pyrophosphatase n=1 Tax=Corynebacterium deserti GIMN1.010 TaxID=931089 RepID=A0A0M3QA38_9CORY|nr:RdgB/HAM1 family non-canonical purine NTP pyrophosphatase [Corynebacterium deserti]ALC06633.1 Non-canonical purine NTP pyrophosphatase [Corynebacterium deserti GIMN1.010]